MKTIRELIESYVRIEENINGVYVYINNNIVCKCSGLESAYFMMPMNYRNVLIDNYCIDSENDLVITVNNESFKQQFGL